MATGISIRSSSGSPIRASAMSRVVSKITKQLEAHVDKIGQKIKNDLTNNRTPARSGQTARAWKFKDRQTGFEIQNNKSWIGSLNEGNHVSKSLSKKKIKPRKQWVQASVKRNTKK